MRFVKNEIQTPTHLVPPEKRKTLMFFLLVIGVAVLVIGVVAFFSTFYFKKMIEARWDISYRHIQRYSIVAGGVGVILYILTALTLKIPLRKTTYYKINTIIRNEPFDPPRKGDYTLPIYMRLRELGDEWELFAEVVPPDSDFKIPQVVTGPGGVFAIYPVNESPERRAFKDPGPGMERAAKQLGNALRQQVTPIIVLPNPKMVEMYKRSHEPRTRLMHIREIFDYFEGRKNKLNAEQRSILEKQVLGLIQGTPPG
jgi:hypothetical protein